jgi:hypothetical protein
MKLNVIRQFKLTSNTLLPYMCPTLTSLIDRWHSILFEGWGENRGSLGLKFQRVCRRKWRKIIVIFLSPSREMPGWCFSWATINPIESSFPGMHKSQAPGRSGDWILTEILIFGPSEWTLLHITFWRPEFWNGCWCFGRPVHHNAKLTE